MIESIAKLEQMIPTNGDLKNRVSTPIAVE